MTEQFPPPPDDESSPAGTTTTSEPPPAAPRQPRPVFRRNTTDKVIAGVAGGLARTFGQDPVIVRIVVVVLAIAFPPAFVAYLAAWLLVARDDEPSRVPTGGIAFRQSGGIGFWIGVVILVAVLLGTLGDPFAGNFGLLPLVLVGIGIALWTRDGGSAASTTGATTTWPATTTQGAAMATTTSTPPVSADGGTPPGPPPVAQPTQPLPVGPPPAPRPRSPLGAITIGVALIATGLVAALDQVEGLPLDADPSHLAAVALLVLGLGQLVGALWGRARWLSLVALFLIPPVVGGAIVREIDQELNLDTGDFQLADGVGERFLAPDAATDLPDDVRLMAGSVRVDLSEWTPDDLDDLDGDEDLVIDIGAGEVILTTPTEVPWRLVGEVRIGEILVDDGSEGTERITTENVGDELQLQRTGGPQDGEVLDIVVDVRLGQLTVVTPEFNSQELS